MHDLSHQPTVWSEILAESRTDLAAGRVSDGKDVRQRLRDSIARLELSIDDKLSTEEPSV